MGDGDGIDVQAIVGAMVARPFEVEGPGLVADDLVGKPMEVQLTGTPVGDVVVRAELGARGVRVLDGGTPGSMAAGGTVAATFTLPWKDAQPMVAAGALPAPAFMQGRLKVTGDMAVALAALRLTSNEAFAAWVASIASGLAAA